MAFPPVNEQMDLLRRGTESIIPEEEMVQKLEMSLKSNQPLKVKLGCDPSRPDLHLGHSVPLRKLRHFQDLGHEAILLVGDFTGMIGDPTGRNKTRPPLSLEQTRQNGQSYYEQASLVLKEQPLRIVYNSEWLLKMDFSDLVRLASHITVARMLERDDFTKRLRDGTPISMHELLYPLAQAYDSVVLEADVELGGTDQTFNLLVGRDFQREYGQAPQVVVITPLLEGTDGKEKMSKSQGNYIGLTDDPADMYGKVMSVPDELITSYFRNCTDIPAGELDEIRNGLTESTMNPRDAKRRLAREIVGVYHSTEQASEAENAFDRLFIHKELPSEIPEFTVLVDDIFLVQVLKEAGLIASNGEGRRLIAQGAVQIDGRKIDDPDHKLHCNRPCTVKVGKRRFLKVK